MMIDWDKVELFFQSVFFRFSFVVFFALFIGIFAYAYYTEVQAPQPMSEAPFDVGAAVHDNTPPTLAEPHRTRKEMQVWIMEVTSELLNFDRAGKTNLLKISRTSFSQAGHAQYQQWLDTFDMAAKVGAGQGRLSAIVDQTPLQLNAGPVAGVYRWLFDVPVVISLLPPAGSRSDTPLETRKATLRLQVARTDNTASPYLVVIESWALTPRR